MSKHPGISPLDHLSDGEPVQEIGELKTNYKSMAVRYALAERVLWAKCSLFKRKIITDCRINGTDDGMLTDFANDIRKLAENEDNVLDETLPKVPVMRKRDKISDPAVI